MNPLADKRPQNPLLTLRELGFSEKDLDLAVSSKFFMDNRQMTLREMMAELERIYADTIGAEFMHIQNTRIRNWVLHRLESRPDKRETPRNVQIRLLRALLEAESFEIFLHSRYVGQKRFSLQGAESLVMVIWTGDPASKVAAGSGGKFAWAWRIAAGSMCWRTSCENRSR